MTLHTCVPPLPFTNASPSPRNKFLDSLFPRPLPRGPVPPVDCLTNAAYVRHHPRLSSTLLTFNQPLKVRQNHHLTSSETSTYTTQPKAPLLIRSTPTALTVNHSVVNMSAAASPAPSEGDSKRGEVSYRFCQEWCGLCPSTKPSVCLNANSHHSSNLLYPKEDRNTSTLLYICKACHATTTHDSACTYRQQLGSTVQETAGVTTDVSNDPTVGAAALELPFLCTLCGDPLRCSKCGAAGLEDSGDSESSDISGTSDL